MSLLDTASLIVTPNGYKEGKLYSVIPSDGTGDLSVTRATTATRVNSAGLVELVPYNFVRYSEQFDNAAWTKYNSITATANQTTAPNGAVTADAIGLSTASTTFPNIAQESQYIQGTVYTFSVYLKKNTINFGKIRIGNAAFSTSTNSPLFNLNTGVVVSGTGTIENVGNGWYRCSMTATANASGTGGFAIDLPDSAGVWNASSVYNVNDSIFAWGAQVNEGTILPYQKTETRLNIPRLDYSNGTCPSILVEPQRTNTILNSVLSGTTSLPTSWNFSISTGTSAPTPSIYSQIGQAYSFTTSATRQAIFQNQSYTSGSSYSFSVFVESVTGSIRVDNVIFQTVAGTQTFYKDGVLINGSDFVESGHRYTTLMVASSTTTAQVRIGNGTGGPTTGTVVLSMPQLEVGSYPTSYIPTTSASVTRNADVISKTGISSLIGQTEGTLFVEIFADAIATLARGIMYVSDGTTNNRVAIQYNSAGNLQAIASSGGTTQGWVIYSYSGNAKIAFAYNSTNYELFVNGFSRGTFVGSLPITLDRLDLGSVITVAQMGGIIKGAAIWKTRLTNDELATLTTI